MQEDFERDIQTTEGCNNRQPRSGVQREEGDGRGILPRSRGGVSSALFAFTKALRLAALVILRSYQLLISPMLTPACRYTPTCSQYMIEAIERYGLIRGIYLGIRRLLRCHPFHPGGYDPVK
jgi:uncharacterized protein